VGFRAGVAARKLHVCRGRGGGQRREELRVLLHRVRGAPAVDELLEGRDTRSLPPRQPPGLINPKTTTQWGWLLGGSPLLLTVVTLSKHHDCLILSF